MKDEIAAALPVPEIDEILSKASLIRAHEAMSCGNWADALWHYSNALKCRPSQVEFYTKLAEALGGHAEAWKQVHHLLINSIKTDPNNTKLRENLRELRLIRRRQREEAKGDGKIGGSVAEIIEESSETITAFALAASEEIKNESRDFQLLGAIDEPNLLSDDIEVDLYQEAAGIGAAEDSFADAEMPYPDAKNSIGCYSSPGNAVFYVRLTETLEQDDEIDDLRADESGEALIPQREDLYDEVAYEPAEERENVPAAEYDWELVNIDLMLAEVSFVYGKELLDKGDRGGAILHFREVLHYASNSVEYYLRLVEVLSENPDTLQEAKNVLLQAIKIWPKNMDLRVALYYLKLGETLNEDQSTQKEAKQILLKGIKFQPDNAEIGDKPIETGKFPKRNSRRLNKRNRKLTKLKATRQEKKAAEPNVAELLEELAELERKAAEELMKKARKRQLLSLRVSQRSFIPADKLLPQKIPGKRWAVLAALVLIVFTGLGYAMAHRGKISPITPIKDKALSVQELQFQWECSEQGLTYVVKVYDKGELIMCQFTKERSYAPDPMQRSLFQPGDAYNWEVLATSNVYKGFKYISEPQNFYISRSVESQVDQPVDQSKEKPSKPPEIKSSPSKTKQPKPPSTPLPQRRID